MGIISKGEYEAEDEQGEGSIAEAAAASFVPSDWCPPRQRARMRFCSRRLH